MVRNNGRSFRIPKFDFLLSGNGFVCREKPGFDGLSTCSRDEHRHFYELQPFLSSGAYTKNRDRGYMCRDTGLNPYFTLIWYYTMAKFNIPFLLLFSYGLES